MTDGSAPVLLFDGQCALCNTAVQFILRHERRHDLMFASLESHAADALLDKCAEPPPPDSMVWISRTGPAVECRSHSSAVLSVIHYLGGAWRLLHVLRWVPPTLRDAGYRVLARHRHRLAAGCDVTPSIEQLADRMWTTDAR